jgi:hypothetical protein
MSNGQLKKMRLILSDEMLVFHKSVHSEDIALTRHVFQISTQND